MPRWTCPNKKHPDAIGSERARQSNTCRWCLPCSATEGVLVERVCLTAEKRRAAAREKRKSELAREQELTRVRMASYPHRLKLLVPKWERLKAWGSDVRILSVTVRSGKKSHSGGHVRSGRHLFITAGTDEASAMATLLYLMTIAAKAGDVRTMVKSNALRYFAWLQAASEICGRRLEAGKAGIKFWELHDIIRNAFQETLTDEQKFETQLLAEVRKKVSGAKQVLEDFMLEQVGVPS